MEKPRISLRRDVFMVLDAPYENAKSFGIQEAESTGTVASALRLFELASVFMRLDHVARFVVNANHGVMRPAVKLGVVDCIADRVRLAVPQARRTDV
jgi:hypothetical protein